MKKLKAKTWIYWGLLILLFLALRLPQIIRNEFAFVFDMGKDHIWVRNIVELKKPTLIGPWGSLDGVYFGPGWYYLLVLPYIIFQGDPRGTVITVMLLNLAVLIVGSWFLNQELDKKAAWLFALLVTLSPASVNVSTTPFFANAIPLLILLMFISFYKLIKKKPSWLWLAALSSSLNFHFEPVTGVVTTLTLLIFIIWHRKNIKLKQVIHSVVAFIIPFAPQIIFEFRHNFLQTKAVLSYFLGENQSLQGKLPFFKRIWERPYKFLNLFSFSILPIEKLTLIAILLLLFILIWLWKTPKTKTQSQIYNLAIFILAVPLFVFIIYSPELKGWYISGYAPIFYLITTLFLYIFINKHKILSTIFLSLYLVLVASFCYKQSIIKPQTTIWGPEILKTQKQVVTQIYQLANNRAFSVYTYTPPIYDYHYQYLFWWMSRQNNWPLPVEYSYLPNEYSYHPQKQLFSQSEFDSPEVTFLIIEPNENTDLINGWLGHFAHLQKVNSFSLPNGITIETRIEKIN